PVSKPAAATNTTPAAPTQQAAPKQQFVLPVEVVAPAAKEFNQEVFAWMKMIDNENLVKRAEANAQRYAKDLKPGVLEHLNSNPKNTAKLLAQEDDFLVPTLKDKPLNIVKARLLNMKNNVVWKNNAPQGGPRP